MSNDVGTTMLARSEPTPATVRASGLFVDNRDPCFNVRLIRAVGPRVAWVVLGAAWFVAPHAAWADEKPTLSGSWTASALSESWSASEWGEACGPKPAPKGAGGGAVQIREQGGELSMVGAGRAFSTAECWEQMPGMSRTSHTQSGGGRFWRTRCSTAASDPRRASVVTSIQATDNSISLTETGEYQFIIHDTICKATVSRSRTYSLVRRDGEEPPVASASASAAPLPPPKATVEAPRPPARCTDAVGEPARLEVHPARKLLRAGERFGFRARVLDADGCPTGAKPTWTIAPGPLATKLNVDPTGGVTVEADAPEGAAEIVASAFGKSVRVTLEVAREENYEALLAARGLNDAGARDEVAVAVIATGTIGGRTVAAKDAARERKTTFIAIVVAVAAMLGFAGLVLARRGTRKEPAPEMGEEGDEGDEGEEYAGAMVAEAEAPPSEAQNGSGRAAGPAPQPGARASRGKICPTCGERYDGEATFCGKDATKLVLIN